ncbi:MAG: Ig-like domain-containing protein [Clostridia bacterium]|nr:Ig-like domain-containing protein [Clostridia bacterium]
MKTVKKSIIITLAFILTLATTLNVFGVNSSETLSESKAIASESTEVSQEYIIHEETTSPNITETPNSDIKGKIYGITLKPDKIFMLPNDTFQLEVNFLTSPPEPPLRTDFIEEEETEVLVTETQVNEESTEFSETTSEFQNEVSKTDEVTTYPDETPEATVNETEEYTEFSESVADTQSETYAENTLGIISDPELTLKPITKEEGDEDLGLIWSSSDEAVAAIGLNGLIYSRELGTAIVTASTPDGIFSASCEINVVEKVPEENENSAVPLGSDYSVAISPNTTWSDKPRHWPVKLATEFSVNFDVYKCDNGGNYIGGEADISSLVNWQSSDTSVATVDIYGRVTGHKNGSTTITVSAKNGDTISVYNTVHVTVYTPYSSNRPGMAKAWVSQYKSTISDCHTDRQAGVVSPGTDLILYGTSGSYILGSIQGETGKYFMWANNLYDKTNGEIYVCKSGNTSNTHKHWDVYKNQTISLKLTSGDSANWTTSDSSIAKINNYTTYTGRTATITPIAEGTAYITVTSGGKIEVVHVTVITRFYDEYGVSENKVGTTKVWCNNFKCSHTKCTTLDRKDSITNEKITVTLYGQSGGFYYANPVGTDKYIYIWKSNVVLQDFNMHCKLVNRDVNDNESMYVPQGFAVGQNECYYIEVRGTPSAETDHRLFRYDVNTRELTQMSKKEPIGNLWHANDAAVVEFTENGKNVPYLFVAAFSMLEQNYIVKLGFDGNEYYEVVRYDLPSNTIISGITLLSGGGNQSAVFLLRDRYNRFYEVTIPNDYSNPGDDGLTHISLNLPSPKFTLNTENISGGAQSICYDQATQKLYLPYANISRNNTNRIYVYEDIQNASGTLSFDDVYDINIYISDTLTSEYYFELEGIGFRPASKGDNRMWFLTFEKDSGDSGIYTSIRYDRNGEIING